MLLDRDEKMTLRYSSQCGSPETLKYSFYYIPSEKRYISLIVKDNLVKKLLHFAISPQYANKIKCMLSRIPPKSINMSVMLHDNHGRASLHNAYNR